MQKLELESNLQLTTTTTKHQSKVQTTLKYFGGWERLAASAFWWGSFLFVIDGAFYIKELGFNYHTALYTLGSFLFLLGSTFLLFLPVGGLDGSA